MIKSSKYIIAYFCQLEKAKMVARGKNCEYNENGIL